MYFGLCNPIKFGGQHEIYQNSACLIVPKGWGYREMKDRSHIEVMVEYLRANPAYSEQLLAEVRRDGSLDELSILLRQMKEAFECDCTCSGSAAKQ